MKPGESRQNAQSSCRLVPLLFLIATREQRVKSNPRSKVFRGEREYGERRQATTEAGKIRVKIAPDGQYLSINGAEVVPVLKKLAEKRGRCVGGNIQLAVISVSTRPSQSGYFLPMQISLCLEATSLLHHPLRAPTMHSPYKYTS